MRRPYAAYDLPLILGEGCLSRHAIAVCSCFLKALPALKTMTDRSRYNTLKDIVLSDSSALYKDGPAVDS